MDNPVLVLWDIDLTLVHAGPASREAYAEAFLAATGRPLTEPVDFGGRTDLHIAREALRAHGILPTDELIAAVNDAFRRCFTARTAQVHREGVPLPGAREALHALAGHRAVLQSVLTGNQAAVAPLKLALLGEAADHLDLAAGAYGDDHADRDRLVPLARTRAAARTGHTYTARRTVLIGDTIRDVAAALANNATAIAVASGRTPAHDLTAAGAHTVLPNLTDTEAVLAAIRTAARAEPAA